MPRWIVFAIGLMFTTCAHHPEPASEVPPTGESAPCDGCAQEGDMKLAMVDSATFLDIAPGFSIHALTNTIGVAGFLKIEANLGTSCKFCQAFSEDGLEFDFGSAHDSMLLAVEPNLHLADLIPGLQVPEQDSSALDSLSQALLHNVWMGGVSFAEFTPWQNKSGLVRDSIQNVPVAIRELVQGMASRWHTRFIVLPIHLMVKINSSAGSHGGYQMQVLWSLWDAQQGSILVLAYARMTLETRADISPDRFWTRPFLAWLGKSLP